MKFNSQPELTSWALSAKHLWLFLDYDGTLADFAPTPDYIEPNPRIISLLEGLRRKPGIRVTILSGRRLQHVRALLPIEGIFLAGSYGIEMLTPDGDTIYRVEYRRIRPALETVKQEWQQIIAHRQGFFLEDKGWTLAIHARFAHEAAAEQVLKQARNSTHTAVATGQFRILGGYKFLEIAPLLASKGEAISHLLSQYPLAEARLLFIGDDDKDEEAFGVVHDSGGVTVKVRQLSQSSSPTAADFLLESPAGTLRWLEQLL